MPLAVVEVELIRFAIFEHLPIHHQQPIPQRGRHAHLTVD